MGRLCERPGCSAEAAMAYGFDASRLLVWLAPYDPSADRNRAGVLCARHAEAMIVPRGWTLDDRRDDRPRLFRSIPAPEERPARPPRRRPARPSGSQQLRLAAAEEHVVEPAVPAARAAPTVPADEPVAAAADEGPVAEERTVREVTGTVADDDVDATVAMPWRPQFDEADDLGGVLAAETPLLSRAFRGIERSR